MTSKDAALLLLLSTIWGSAFLFNHVAVQDIPALAVVASRLTIATAFVAPFAARNGRLLPRKSLWPSLAALAAFNNVLPFALITAAQEHLTSGLTATLVATMPLFTLAFAYASGTERVNVGRTAGLFVGFVGAALLIGPDLTDFRNSNTLAELAVIAAAASYGVATVIARRTATGSAAELASGQLLFATCMAIPLALIWEGTPAGDASAKALLSVLALGAVCTGAAYVIFFVLIERILATQLSIVSYLMPVVATILGWLVLDERTGLNLVAGLVLVILGAMAVSGGWRFPPKHAPHRRRGARPSPVGDR